MTGDFFATSSAKPLRNKDDFSSNWTLGFRYIKCFFWNQNGKHFCF